MHLIVQDGIKHGRRLMSRYCTVKTQFSDGDALVAALMETGNWTEEQIEVHDVAKHLFGFQNKQRPETANVIIRREYVGTSSNDIGFTLGEDGSYEAIISVYDSTKYGEKWIGQLKGNYAYNKVHREMTEKGRTVERIRGENGYQRLEVTGYR